MPLDLFGEVPVTLDDVLAWMLAVPGIAPDSMRFGPYIRDYQVLDKIRQAKASGTFEAAIAEPRALPVRLRVHVRPPGITLKRERSGSR